MAEKKYWDKPQLMAFLDEHKRDGIGDYDILAEKLRKLGVVSKRTHEPIQGASLRVEHSRWKGARQTKKQVEKELTGGDAKLETIKAFLQLSVDPKAKLELIQQVVNGTIRVGGK